MNKKKVYLAQVNVTYNDYIAYLPYAAGCIAAYAWADDEIAQTYELGDILYMRLRVEESLEKEADQLTKQIDSAKEDIEYYESDIENRIAEEIDQIIWDINRNVDIYSTDGIDEVLWNAVNEGGIEASVGVGEACSL